MTSSLSAESFPETGFLLDKQSKIKPSERNIIWRRRRREKSRIRDKWVEFSEVELPPVSPPSNSLHPSMPSGTRPADSDETQHYPSSSSLNVSSLFSSSSPLPPLSALSPSCCDLPLSLLHSLLSLLQHKKLVCKHFRLISTLNTSEIFYSLKRNWVNPGRPKVLHLSPHVSSVRECPH